MTEIHPAPSEFSNAQISTDPILHFFHYSHLPPKLRETSRSFFILAAHVINTLPRNPERTVALRKLLEAKGYRPFGRTSKSPDLPNRKSP